MEGMLVILSGPSGSGKGTVVKNLDPLKNYALSISATTRPKRANEEDGRDYFFRTEAEFARMLQNNELLEHIAYVGNYYGTPRFYVEEQIAQGKVVVLEIEVYGALQVREIFSEAVLIFLLPPSRAELVRRLSLRNTENAVIIEDRLKRADEEIAMISQYDYLVINDTVAEAVARVDAIVMAERLRPKRNLALISRFSNPLEPQLTRKAMNS